VTSGPLRSRHRPPTWTFALGAVFLLGAGWGCEPGPDPVSRGEVVFEVPSGASFSQVADTLERRALVRHTLLFRAYARLRGVDRSIRAGTYALPRGSGWDRILDDLVEGRIVTVPVTVPEGLTLPRIAERVAPIVEASPERVLEEVRSERLAEALGVPGPGLEGYLFPDTYRFAPGTPVARVAETMVRRYRSFWTKERRARLRDLALTEKEAVTLASIVQAEGRLEEEMDTIAAVYHNRLRRGYPLQADPTVLYALGGHRERLLYAAMDSVADHPYNTYTHPGLPPGPIGAPGEAALEATLDPAETDYLYFVARLDGSHIFSHTLSEHNQAVRRARRERDEARRRGATETRAAPDEGASPPG